MKKIEQTQKNRKTTKGDIFYVLCLISLFLLHVSIFCVNIVWLKKYLFSLEIVALSILFLVALLNVYKSRIKAKTIAILILLLFIAAMSVLLTNNTIACYLILMPIGLSHLSLDKIIKIDLLIKIIVSISIFIFYLNGGAAILDYSRGEMARSAFGFAHPNSLGYMCVAIFFDCAYLIRKKPKSTIRLLLVATILFLLCLYSGSRTATIILLLAIIVAIFKTRTTKVIRKRNKTSNRLLLFIPVTLVGISFLSSSLYGAGNQYFIKLDGALSYRISLQNHYDKTHRISLFGEHLNEIKKYPLDNGYYRITYSTGLFGLFTLITIAGLALSKANKDDEDIKWILTILLIYGLSEWIVFNLPISPFWSKSLSVGEEKKNEEA